MHMTNNLNTHSITRSHFDEAITLLTMMRDRALDIETDLRAGDPLADFTDAVEMMIELAREQTSPDSIDAMLNLLNSVDL